MSGRWDSKVCVCSFNGLMENVEAVLHTRNTDSACDTVIDDKSEIEIDYGILIVNLLEEAVLKFINDATRHMGALFQKSYWSKINKLSPFFMSFQIHNHLWMFKLVG